MHHAALRRGLARGLVAVSGLALTACGSTVPLAQTHASGSAGELQAPGASLPGSTAALTGAQQGTAAAAASAGVPGNGSPAAQGRSVAVGGTGPGAFAPTAGEVSGPGVTATTITVGLVYATNSQAADEAMGANGITNGDDVAEVRILINDINKHGGVAGRRLALLPYGEDSTSTQPYAATAQAMCSYMTQDHKVLAVVGTGFGDAKECLNRAGTAQFDGSLLGLSDSDGRSQIDFATAAMNVDRSMVAAVKAWTVGGWFGAWNTVSAAPDPQGHFKLGVLTVDEAALNHAVDKVLVPEIVRAGYPPPAPQDIIRLSSPASAGDDGGVLAAIQNAVLKFRQDGVDHVVIMDSNGSATLFFANDAYSQRYFPRLGGGSGNAFQTLLETGNIQAQSMAGAVAAGWTPVLDLPYGSEHKYESPAAARCRDLMTQGGQSLTSANAEAYALGYCDLFTIMSKALNGARTLTALGMSQSVEQLGRSLASALTVGLLLGPGHHDGAGAIYSNVYSAGCSCFGYRGARQLL